MNNTLREEVVREWNTLAQRIAKEKQFTVFLDDKFGEFFAFFNTWPGTVKVATKLGYWIDDDYRTKLQQSKDEVGVKADEINNFSLSSLQSGYFGAVNAFMVLTLGWWEEKQKGPTIEEVD